MKEISEEGYYGGRRLGSDVRFKVTGFKKQLSDSVRKQIREKVKYRRNWTTTMAMAWQWQELIKPMLKCLE